MGEPYRYASAIAPKASAGKAKDSPAAENLPVVELADHAEMTEAEKRAAVRDWNLMHSWGPTLYLDGTLERLDLGHRVLLECVAAAQERSMHATGRDELLSYYGLA